MCTLIDMWSIWKLTYGLFSDVMGWMGTIKTTVKSNIKKQLLLRSCYYWYY